MSLPPPSKPLPMSGAPSKPLPGAVPSKPLPGTGSSSPAPKPAILTKPLVKVDINGHGMVKTFAIEPQNTFKDLCSRLIETHSLSTSETDFSSYRIFLIETSSDGQTAWHIPVDQDKLIINFLAKWNSSTIPTLLFKKVEKLVVRVVFHNGFKTYSCDETETIGHFRHRVASKRLPEEDDHPNCRIHEHVELPDGKKIEYILSDDIYVSELVKRFPSDLREREKHNFAYKVPEPVDASTTAAAEAAAESLLNTGEEGAEGATGEGKSGFSSDNFHKALIFKAVDMHGDVVRMEVRHRRAAWEDDAQPVPAVIPSPTSAGPAGVPLPGLPGAKSDSKPEGSESASTTPQKSYAVKFGVGTPMAGLGALPKKPPVGARPAVGGIHPEAGHPRGGGAGRAKAPLTHTSSNSGMGAGQPGAGGGGGARPRPAPPRRGGMSHTPAAGRQPVSPAKSASGRPAQGAKPESQKPAAHPAGAKAEPTKQPVKSEPKPEAKPTAQPAAAQPAPAQPTAQPAASAQPATQPVAAQPAAAQPAPAQPTAQPAAPAQPAAQPAAAQPAAAQPVPVAAVPEAAKLAEGQPTEGLPATTADGQPAAMDQQQMYQMMMYYQMMMSNPQYYQMMQQQQQMMMNNPQLMQQQQQMMMNNPQLMQQQQQMMMMMYAQQQQQQQEKQDPAAQPQQPEQTPQQPPQQ